MSGFTSSQYGKFSTHANLKWLKDRQARGQLIPQDIIEAKITEAITSAFPDRVTRTNISWVADQLGIYWGQVYQVEGQVQGAVAAEAEKELTINDIYLAQAMRMVFEGTAAGRTAPDRRVNHIHVGGNAQLNLLFVPTTKVILGLVNGHMQKDMSPTVSNEAARICQRFGKPTVQMRIAGGDIRKV